MSNLDMKALAESVLDELTLRAKKFGARMIDQDKEVLTAIAKDVAEEAAREALTGEHRSREWNHIAAQSMNVTAADAELFRQQVKEAGDFLTGILKAVVKVVV